MFDYQPCLRQAVIYNCYKVHPGKIPSFSDGFLRLGKTPSIRKKPKSPGNIPIAIRNPPSPPYVPHLLPSSPIPHPRSLPSSVPPLDRWPPIRHLPPATSIWFPPSERGKARNLKARTHTVNFEASNFTLNSL